MTALKVEKGSLASATVLGAVATGVTAVSALVRAKASAVVLGVAGVGLVAEIQQLIALLSVPTTALTGAALTRRLVDARARGGAEVYRESARQSAMTTVVFTALAAVAVVLLAPWLLSVPAAQVSAPAALAGSAAVATAMLGVYTQSLVVHGDFKRGYFATSLNAILAASFAVAGVVLWGLPGLFAGLLVAALLVGGVAMRLARASISPGRWSPAASVDVSFARSAVRFGGASLASGLVLQLALSAIRYGLLRRGGHELNGLFQAAWSMDSLLVGTLTTGLSAYFFPRFAAAENAAALQGEVDAAARFLLGFGAPVLLAFAALRGVVLPVIYSSDFHPASGLLGLLVVGDVFRLLGWVAAGPLLYRNEVRAFVIADVSAAVILGSVSLALIEPLGLLGVGVAQVVAYAAYLPLARRLLRSTTQAVLGVGVVLKGLALAGAVLVVVVVADAHPLGWVVGALAAAGVFLGGAGGRALVDRYRRLQ